MRHKNQSINPIKSNAPLGVIRGLDRVKPDPDDELEPESWSRAKAIPAWVRKLVKFGRPRSSEPSLIVNPTSENPIGLPIHRRLWLCPEGEARGHFEIYWDQNRAELVIKTHPGRMVIKVDCSNRISIVAVSP